MNIITLSPAQFKEHYEEARARGTLTCQLFKTPAGVLTVEATELGVFKAQFVDAEPTDLGHPAAITTIILSGTPFQLAVWRALLDLSPGQILSYQELARAVGRPTAHRAVANAVGANKIAYFVPCHQVIRADGTLGGYRWGAERKKMLLNID